VEVIFIYNAGSNGVQSVPRESAILGLPGGRETVIRMDADHGDVCRFDPGNETDQQNYRRLEVALMRTCKFALKEGEKRYVFKETLKPAVGNSVCISASPPNTIYRPLKSICS
jgi:hypothetical protein